MVKTLNQNYSTARLCYKLLDDEYLDKNGKIKDELKFKIKKDEFGIVDSKIPAKEGEKFDTLLFLPEGEGRKGEGGLRTKGYFKFSYANLIINDECLILNDKYGNEFKLDKNTLDNSTLKIQNSKLNQLPLISIITVVYNGEKYLEETIKSVINQTYPNVEYIIIDGGSTDGTLDIIKKYEDYIDYWVSEKDMGISDAFNKGIICLLGSISLLLNADDLFYENNIIEKVIHYIYKNTFINQIYTTTIIFDKGFSKKINKPAGIKKIRERMPFNHPGSFIPINIYKQIGLYNEDYKIAMDYDFYIRCFHSNINFHWIDLKSVIMRTEGISSTNFINAYKEALDIQNNYFGKKIINYLFLYKKILLHSLGYLKNKFIRNLTK